MHVLRNKTIFLHVSAALPSLCHSRAVLWRSQCLGLLWVAERRTTADFSLYWRPERARHEPQELAFLKAQLWPTNSFREHL